MLRFSICLINIIGLFRRFMRCIIPNLFMNKRLICIGDFLKFFLSNFITFICIWVIFFGQFVICLFNVFICGMSWNTKYFMIFCWSNKKLHQKYSWLHNILLFAKRFIQISDSCPTPPRLTFSRFFPNLQLQVRLT